MDSNTLVERSLLNRTLWQTLHLDRAVDLTYAQSSAQSEVLMLDAMDALRMRPDVVEAFSYRPRLRAVSLAYWKCVTPLICGYDGVPVAAIAVQRAVQALQAPNASNDAALQIARFYGALLRSAETLVQYRVGVMLDRGSQIVPYDPYKMPLRGFLRQHRGAVGTRITLAPASLAAKAGAVMSLAGAILSAHEIGLVLCSKHALVQSWLDDIAPVPAP